MSEFIGYPEAMRKLEKRYKATPTELATWVWLGPEHGGLRAFLNANELEHPPRFIYTDDSPIDVVGPLMSCWFEAQEITEFTPEDRFIGASELIARWSHPHINVEDFIAARIQESRLEDYHPATGATQWSEGEPYAPREAAIFPLSHVEQIEAEEQLETRQGDKFAHQPASHLSKAEIRKAETKILHSKWKNLAQELKEEDPTRSLRWIAKVIAKRKEAEGRTAATITRKLVTPKK